MKGLSFLFTLMFLFACQTGNKSVVLGPDEFNSKIVSENVQILDVRSQEEFNAGHIANAIHIDISMPGFEEASNILYKDIPVYVYCQKDPCAANAVQKLKELGFKEVFELKNGITAWLEKGLPLVKVEPKKVYANDTIPFKEAIKGDKLVLVDFNATWCKPCKIIQPIIDKIHDERTDDVIVYSIDVDQHPELAAEYEASSIPLLLMFKKNEIVYKHLGVVEGSVLNEAIDKNK